MELKIDKFGRIVIPKRLRRKLGLYPGGIVKVEEADSWLVLKRASRPKREIGIDKGKIIMSDDFNAPLSDFEDYMT